MKIRRLTYGLTVHGIVRGSPDGSKIAFLAEDENRIKQAFIIDSRSTESNLNTENHFRQVSRFTSGASFIRWHPSGNWVFAVVYGNIAALYTGEDENFGTTFWLTNDEKERAELVVSNNGNMLAYNMLVLIKLEPGCTSRFLSSNLNRGRKNWFRLSEKKYRGDST